jgi:hypothetical protein
MAKVFEYFLLPFIDVEMDLSQQVKSLSTYAHLCTAMYFKHKLEFLTGALYADSQAIVKNIVFTIARLQLIDGTIEYYIIHDGTDRLERTFSNVCIQDHSRNFDIAQLGHKVSIASEINATMEQNPELDAGSRRLNLKDAKGIDHVNPKSWLGNVEAGRVNDLG